jgi:catechol 2,3-dioxygenase-like lactoylglutathione lyase family enzyme
VEQLHHALVLTDDVDGTVAFYRDALGFAVADTPPLPFPGVWLRLDGDACVHVAERAAYERWTATLGLPPSRTGSVDHLAFRRADHEALVARLEAAGVETVHNDVPGMFRQLFVTDPNGVRVELNVSR